MVSILKLLLSGDVVKVLTTKTVIPDVISDEQSAFTASRRNILEGMFIVSKILSWLRKWILKKHMI